MNRVKNCLGNKHTIIVYTFTALKAIINGSLIPYPKPNKQFISPKLEIYLDISPARDTNRKFYVNVASFES